MFWPSPEDSLNSSEVVVCPTRKFTDHSFTIKRQLDSMESDVAEDGPAEVIQFSTPEPLCFSFGCDSCSTTYMLVSPKAARDLRHRQSSCHLEFPR